MYVENLFVDDISLDTDRKHAQVTSVIYRFQKQRWVSSHRERSGSELGPFILLGEDPVQQSDIKMEELGERPLATKVGRRIVISYKDTWTIQKNSIYTLVLPKGFVASQIKVAYHEDFDWAPEAKLAASRQDRLFYYAVFGQIDGDHIIDVEARILKDQKKYLKELNTAEVLNGTRGFKIIVRNLPGLLETAGTGLKLVDFLRKLGLD